MIQAWRVIVRGLMRRAAAATCSQLCCDDITVACNRLLHDPAPGQSRNAPGGRMDTGDVITGARGLPAPLREGGR
jgi:hypothetical protein